MTDFVEQCRKEWRRLGVPDSLAEEMTTDLASDLEEANAEGVSAQELLGSSAFDPRSFAASWAAERGIIPEPPRPGARRTPLVLVAFTAIAAIAVIVAAAALLAGPPHVSLVRVGKPRLHLPSAPAGSFVQPGSGQSVLLRANTAAPFEWILLLLAVVALGFAAWLWVGRGRSRPPSVPA